MGGSKMTRTRGAQTETDFFTAVNLSLQCSRNRQENSGDCRRLDKFSPLRQVQLENQ